MSLLGSFGRSNAYQIGRDLIAQSRDVSLIPLQAEEANTRNILTSQQVAARQQDMALKDMQLKQQKDQADRNNKLVDSADVISRDPNAGKFMVDKMREYGMTQDIDTPMGKKTFIRAADYLKFKTEILPKDYESSLTLGWHRYATLDEAKNTAAAALQKAREGGDEAKIQQAEKAYSDAKGATEQLGASLLESDRKIQAELAKKKAESFTLGKGQQRFDSSGNVIAEGAKEVKEQWSEPYDMILNGKPTRVQKESSTGKVRTVASGPVAEVNIGEQMEKKQIESLIKQMPKLKDEAHSQNVNIGRIDRMSDLLDKGVGGKIGKLKGWLAPYAEAVGYDIPNMNEAQTYELLAKTLGGSMRMAIVGPGQVSNFEQNMLQMVNGGGNAATGAAKELLKYYRETAMNKVNAYNESVDSLNEGSKNISKIYKKIEIKSPSKQEMSVVETRKLPNGEIWESLSDGSYRKKE